MLRQCDICGTTYDAVRINSKYCGPTCRQRKYARGRPPVKPGNVIALGTLPPPGPAESTEAERGPVETATLRVLTEVERESTPLGESAIALARRVDSPREMGAGLAALVKQLEQTLRSATSGVHEDASPLDKARDELAARRATHGA